MKNGISLSSFIAILLAAGIFTGASAADSVKTVVITANDSMKFSVTRIEASPGQKIHVQLRNEGTLPKEVMGHNWILLKAGQDITVYTTAALAAKDQNYQPKSLSSEVLACIPLLGAKQSGEAEFDAPAVPGRYPFICSFPAHCQVGMRGELVVK